MWSYFIGGVFTGFFFTSIGMLIYFDMTRPKKSETTRQWVRRMEEENKDEAEWKWDTIRHDWERRGWGES